MVLEMEALVRGGGVSEMWLKIEWAAGTFARSWDLTVVGGYPWSCGALGVRANARGNAACRHSHH